MRHFLLRLLLLRDAVKCSALNLKLCVVLTQNLVRIWASGCDAVWTTNDGPSVCLFVLTSQQEVIIPREFWELLLSEVRILDPRQCVPDIYETCVPSKCRERLSSDMASFIHSFFFCLPNDRDMAISHQVLHTVPCNVPSFHLQYPLLSLRPFSTLLRLLPRLPVTYFPCHSFNIPKERDAQVRRCTERKSVSVTEPELNDSDIVTT